jgi:hypothetical protein
MHLEEGPKHLRMMILGIIQDHHRFSSPVMMFKQSDEEILEGDGIKRFLKLGHQLALPQVDGPKQGHGLSGGCHSQDRIFVLWRNPHGGPGSMLLEMAFIEAPRVEIVPSGEPEAFF